MPLKHRTLRSPGPGARRNRRRCLGPRRASRRRRRRSPGTSAPRLRRRLPAGTGTPARSGRPATRTFWPASLLSPSPLHRRAVTQEPPGPEDQDQDENGEDDDVRPPDANVLVVHRADDADEDAAQNRPDEVPDTAQDRRREREEPLPEAQVKDGRAVEEPEHDTRGPGEDAAEQKGHRDGAVDVYPHHRRRFFILRYGPHRLALPGAPDKVREAHEQRYRDDDNEEVLPAVGDRVGDPGEGVAVGDQGRERYLEGALPDQPYVLQDEGHAYGRDQDGQTRGAAQRPVSNALDSDVD